MWPGLTLLAVTCYLEAENEPEDGQLAVAFNPCNRARLNGWELHRAILGSDVKAYDDGKPWEAYSCWNDDYRMKARLRVADMSDKVFQHFFRLAVIAWWELKADPSNNAYFYLNPELTRQIRGGSLPDWWDIDGDPASELRLGRHVFRRLR